MPTYLYVCELCHEQAEIWRSIHSDTQNHRDCLCGGQMLLTMTGEAIATPRSADRRDAVQAIDAKEDRWGKDMPAYKRLRHQGYHPQRIDGADRMEATAESELEINSGGVVKGPDAKVREAMALAQEITQGNA